MPAGTIESFIALHLPLKEARHAWTKSFELVYVRAMLKMVGGNVTRAAKRLQISRKSLQVKMKELGLREVDAGE